MIEGKPNINILEVVGAMEQDIILAYYGVAPDYEKTLYWRAPAGHFKVIVEGPNEESSEQFEFESLVSAVNKFNEV